MCLLVLCPIFSLFFFFFAQEPHQSSQAEPKTPDACHSPPPLPDYSACCFVTACLSFGFIFILLSLLLPIFLLRSSLSRHGSDPFLSAQTSIRIMPACKIDMPPNSYAVRCREGAGTKDEWSRAHGLFRAVRFTFSLAYCSSRLPSSLPALDGPRRNRERGEGGG